MLGEINQAITALDLATMGDAKAAIDIAAVSTAQAQADGSQANALSLHITANDLARKAIIDLRSELQFTGEGPTDTPPVVSHPNAMPEMQTREWRDEPGYYTTAPAMHQHSVITQALNLGIPWGKILQALLNAGLPALQKLIQQWLNNTGPGTSVPPK